MKIEIEKLTTLYQYILDISSGHSLQHLLNYWHFLVEQFRNGMLFRCSFLRIKTYTFFLPNYIIDWLIRLQIGYLDNPRKTNSTFFSKVSFTNACELKTKTFQILFNFIVKQLQMTI